MTVAGTARPGDILNAVAELRHAGGLEVDLRAEKAVTVVDNTFPLMVAYSATPNPVVAGQRVEYSMTVTNGSAAPVSGVTVLYRVPVGIEFLGVQDADPNAGGCGVNNNLCTAGEEASWSLGTLAAGASTTIQVNALVVAGTAAGTLLRTPVAVTATGLGDTISVEATVVVDNP